MHPRTPHWAWLALSTLLLYLSLHASTANALDTDCVCLPEPASTGNFPDASSKAARDAVCKQQCLTKGGKSDAFPGTANSVVGNQLVATETTPAVGTPAVPAATDTVGASSGAPAPSVTGTSATTVASNSTAATSNGQSEESNKGSFFGNPVLMGFVFGGLALILVPMMVMSTVRWHRRRSEAKRAYDTPFHSTQKRLKPITSANFVEPDMSPIYQIPGSPALGPSGSGFPTRPRPSPGYASPSLGPTYQGPTRAFSRTDSVISSNSHYASDGFPPRSPAPYAPSPAPYGPAYGEGYGRPL